MSIARGQPQPTMTCLQDPLALACRERRHRSDPSKMSVRTRSPRRRPRGRGTTPARRRGRRAAAGCAGTPPGCGRRRRGGGLRRVRPHRRPLGPGVPAHVDPVGDLGAGREGPLEADVGSNSGGEPVDPADEPRSPGTISVARHGRLEHPRRAGDLGRPRADLVHAHVVAVPVAAVGVVGQQHVGALGRAASRRAARRPPRGRRAANRVHPAGRAQARGRCRVGVAEPLHPGHARAPRRSLRLRQPPLAEPPVAPAARAAARPAPRRSRAPARPGDPRPQRAPSCPRSAAPRRRGGRGRPRACAAHRGPSSPHGRLGPREGRPALRLLPAAAGWHREQVHDLARQLRAAGHEVEVFTATTGPHGERGGAHRDRRRRRHGAPARHPAARRNCRSTRSHRVRCVVGSPPGASTSPTRTSAW